MNCKWCGARTKRTAAPSVRPGWKRWVCGGCGTLGYDVDPEVKELEVLYQVAWADPDSDGRFASGSTSNQIADSLIGIACNGGGEIGDCLDYGSGRGFLAKQLIEAGWKTVHAIEPFGRDPDIPGVEWHRAWEELPIGARFDWIFMVEVVEHLLDPLGELRKARSLLSDSGMVLITTPNARGWRARFGQGKWREAQNPTHLNLFSYRALKLCLQRAGYTEIRRVNKTMSFGKKGVAGLMLRLTQILKMDGGLRVLAR